VCANALRCSQSDRARLTPLVLATAASQALLVVLAPTIVAIGAGLGMSVGAVGQARTIAAAGAIAASFVVAPRIDAVAVSRLLALGAGLAIVACAAVAAAPTPIAFLLAHLLVGIAVACLLSGGFAGVATFAPERRAWAVGWVAGANSLAWIVVAPAVGLVADRLSWRAAQAVPAGVALAALLAARTAASAPGRRAVPRVRIVFAHRSARRWIGAELLAYGAWTALLTFVGAFFVQRVAVGQASLGWLLAAGAAAHFAASTRGGAVADGMPRRRLVAASALIMAILFVVLLDVAGSPPIAMGAFCLLGLAAGMRSPAASGLGLEQLPDHPGAMMAARTAATQLGYLLGALVGGSVIAAGGYGALGVVLAAGMASSAWLVLRVDDPRETTPQVGRSDGGSTPVDRDPPVRRQLVEAEA
jgi:MFS transporter, YNFM family, putative membrane transport protein